MPTILKSPFDKARFKNKKDLEKYIEKHYKDKIPLKYDGDVAHFLYDFRNGGPRKCQICGQVTEWNPKKKMYSPLCDISNKESMNELDKAIQFTKESISKFRNKGNTCSQVMRKEYVNNIKRIYNTDNLMEDPEYQKMLLENRSIADVATFNGLQYTVIGSWEKKFVEELEKGRKENKINPNLQLVMPGPTVYYDDNKYWIPDAYLPQYDLYISIKDDGDNPSYLKHYKKDCEVFTYLFTKTEGKWGIIELNSKQLKNIVNIIKGPNTYPLSEEENDKFEEIIPVYMKRLFPDLYKKCKLKYNRDIEIIQKHLKK